MSSDIIKSILANYESDNPGTKANLYRILNTGRLAGTGKLVILPVDQGYEHGPAASFAPNPAAYDPHYLYELALKAQLNAFAAPLGLLETGADTFAGQIPLILKLNNANGLFPSGSPKDQAITGSVTDAIRIGASAIGFTMYPGSEKSYDMMEEVKELIREARSHGIASVVWSYPRGGDLASTDETAVDVISYATHMAALLGAHIIKVKIPGAHFKDEKAKAMYAENGIATATAAERVAHIVQCAFQGKRMVVFSGGGKKGADAVFEDAQAILKGGGNGSIIGRNSFQRSMDDACDMLGKVIDIYK
ncbi:MAG: class I fructose-bisphosphate aldolase [Rhizobiaceae bacterium]